MSFVTRAYNRIELNKLKGTVTKTSKETRLLDEINYYNNLPKNLAYYFPRIIDSGKKDDLFFMELEYYPFQNLYQFLTSKPSVELQKNLFDNLLFLLNEFSQIKFDYDRKDVENLRNSIFIQKTEKEYLNLKNNFPFFKELCKQNAICVNGEWYDNFETVWSKAKQFIEKNYIKEEQTELSFMHGDFCFSNILVGVDKNNNVVLRLLDPRGSFGILGNHGDSYYDLAKFIHSVEGRYEDIIYDNFTMEKQSVYGLHFINYKFNTELGHVLKPLSEVNLYTKFDRLKIKLLESTIFLGMCARHFDSLDRQKIMYATGVKILNECLKEIKNA